MNNSKSGMDRRTFLGTTGLTAAALSVPNTLTAQPPMPDAGEGAPVSFPWEVGDRLYRVEADIKDCVVEGTIPSDLNGAFYRVGPDSQYAMRPENIPWDGEGHASMTMKELPVSTATGYMLLSFLVLAVAIFITDRFVPLSFCGGRAPSSL